MREHPAVTLARNKKDVVVLLVALFITVVLASTYAIIRMIAVLITNNSNNDALLTGLVSEVILWGIWMVVLGVLLLFVMFVIRLQRQQFLASALNIRHSNLAWLRDWSAGVAAEVGMPPLEIFIVQEPYLNAFAFGFMKPYCIVLHSATVERLTDEELKAVVVHEMAHVKYAHTNISVYLAPLTAIPFAGVFISWLFGFWSRRAEITADRFAVAYLQKPELMFRALLKIYMGPDVAKRASIEGVWNQLTESSNNMNQFAESLSSHPFLVRRALNIYNFSKDQNYSWDLNFSK